MYFDYLVPVPQLVGKITRSPNKNGPYVRLEVGREYKAQSKYNVPVRETIGKIADEEKMLMHPNENYLKHFPEQPLQEAEGSKRSACIAIGSFLALQLVSAEYEMDAMLEPIFGKQDAGLIKDLIAFLIDEEDNAMQHFEQYARGHALFTPGMVIRSDSTIARLLSQRITDDKRIAFLDVWNQKYRTDDKIYVSYDSTNFNNSAGDIDLVSWAKPKYDQGKKVYGFAVAYDMHNKVPLLYETYDGSIIDVSQLKQAIEKFKAYNYLNLGFILDRGYHSIANIKYLDENGYDIVMMVKGCKKLVSGLIEQNLHTFENARDKHIKRWNTYGMTTTGQLFDGDEKTRYFHLFYSPEKYGRDHAIFNKTLDDCESYLDSKIGKSINPTNEIEKYYEIKLVDVVNPADGEIRKVLQSYSPKMDVINRENRLLGYFVIVTTEKMTAEQALTLYRGRDTSEKLFRTCKTFLGARSARVHSNEALEGKMFVQFLAMIYRNYLFNKLQETVKKLNIKGNWMTVPTALRELNKIEVVQYNKGVFRLAQALTKTQKTILSALGLEGDALQLAIGKVIQDLNASESTVRAPDADDEADAKEAELDEFQGPSFLETASEI